MEAVIKFKGYKINKINFIRTDKEELDKSDPLKIETSINDNLIEAFLKLNLHILNEGMEIEVEVVGEFNSNGDLELNDFKRFLVVNGTAIIYPYIRSIVSMISSLDSEKTIILPTINTTNFKVE